MKLGRLKIQPQRVAIFIGIAIVLFLILDFNTRVDDLSRLQNGLATQQALGTSVVVTQYVLQTQVAYSTSDAAVQEYARNQAHLIQPGDHVVVPIAAPNATPAPTATPAPKYGDKTNWEVWMQYLFGK